MMEHDEALSALSALEQSEGWKLLMAHFDAEMKKWGAAILDPNGMPAEAAIKQREIRAALIEEHSPAKILETLKDNHRAGARRESPPRTT